MPRIERVREAMTSPPSPDYLQQKANEGWRLVAVEWQRTVDDPAADAEGLLEQEIPYGLQVAADCRHLTENPVEIKIMLLMLEQIVDDHPLSRVAEELNRRGYTTRDDDEWTQTHVFYMLPRLIDVAPRIFSSEEWRERRQEVTSRLQGLIQ